MSGVVIVNTVGSDGRWIFEQLARDGRLAVLMDQPEKAVHLARRSGGVVGIEAVDGERILALAAAQSTDVALVVITLDEESEIPGTPHRWIALDRPGSLKRILSALEQAHVDGEEGTARPIARR